LGDRGEIRWGGEEENCERKEICRKIRRLKDGRGT
jgi:hypothetical protein